MNTAFKIMRSIIDHLWCSDDQWPFAIPYMPFLLGCYYCLAIIPRSLLFSWCSLLNSLSFLLPPKTMQVNKTNHIKKRMHDIPITSNQFIYFSFWFFNESILCFNFAIWLLNFGFDWIITLKLCTNFLLWSSTFLEKKK